MEENNKTNNNDNEQTMRPTRRNNGSSKDLLTRFFDDDFFEPFRLPHLFGRLDDRFFPRVDVSETDTEVRVVADIPGVNEEDVDIDVLGNRMTISGHTDREEETNDNMRPYRYERTYGEWRREITLPARVKEDEAKASCKNGVLTITLPKAEGEIRKKIKINKE